MRVLVTGARGQLGSELRRCIDRGRSDIGPIDRAWGTAQVDYVGSAELDVSAMPSVDAWFRAHDPYDVVINCAAMTDVDGCEKDFPRAFATNALGPMNLAIAAERQGAKLVHVSTDYVFSGEEPGDRLESDVPCPISAYGRSKLAGEGLARSRNPRTFVVRTAWLYGLEGRNFAKTMLRLAKTHPQVTVVDDQVGNPTSASDLAHELLALSLTDAFGTYHATCEGTCSWADFAQAVFEEFGVGCSVERCSSEDYLAAHPDSARRPHFSALDGSGLYAVVPDRMRPWREALKAFRDNYQEVSGGTNA